MKLTKEDVIEYFSLKMPELEFDSEVLEAVIESFDSPVSMDTILNRHNDVLDGRTALNGSTVTLSLRSSITELDIEPSTYTSLVKSCIMHCNDINDDMLCNLRTLTLEALADATGALLKSGLLEM